MKAKKKETRFIESVKGVLDETKNQILGVVGSTGTIDRQGESVNPMGWQLDNFLKNPVIMYGHDYSTLPVGKANRVWVENGELKFDLEFATTDFAKEVFELFKGKFLNAFSVGFIPSKFGISGVDQYDIMEQELLELSVVAVPANPEALAYLKSNAPTVFKSIKGEELEEKKDEKKEEPKPEVEEVKAVKTISVDIEKNILTLTLEDEKSIEFKALPEAIAFMGEMQKSFDERKAKEEAQAKALETLNIMASGFRKADKELGLSLQLLKGLHSQLSVSKVEADK